MPQPTLTIPTDCPGCKAKACGHVCNCGAVDYPPAENGKRRRKCDRQHRYCCTCGLCYEPVDPADEFDST